MEFNASAVKDKCVQWIRSWFESNGNGCNAVIGISGGKDSTVTAALCVEALGKDRVIGVLMPNNLQPDINDSYEVVKLLGIKHIVLNIAAAHQSILHLMTDMISFSEEGYKRCEFIEPSSQSKINLAPRIRMAVLYAVAQSVNGRVVNTCNLSEDYIGYFTRYGDGAGDFAPLGGLTSDEVMAIGDVLGIPEHLSHKVPSDGLCGLTDEDNFGFSYDVLNRYIRTGQCDDPAAKEKIDGLHQKNLFKIQPVDRFIPSQT